VVLYCNLPRADGLMAARLSVKELTKLLREADIDTTGALEKVDLVFLVHTSHDTITP
jgi:hypothetical protein